MKKWFLLALTFFTIVFFNAILPVPFMHHGPLFLSFLGGGLAALCFLFAFKKSDDEMNDNNSSVAGYVIVGSIAIAFATSLGTYLYFSTREENFIKQNPVLTYGRIIDGQSSKVKSSTTYTLNVEFKDANDIPFTESIDASSSEWNNAYINKYVNIVYEKENPAVCKLFHNIEDAKKFTDNKIKLAPVLTDLFTLLEQKPLYYNWIKSAGTGWRLYKTSGKTGENKWYDNMFTKDVLVIFKDGITIFNKRGYTESIDSIVNSANKIMTPYKGFTENSIDSMENEKFKVGVFSFGQYRRYNDAVIRNNSGGVKMLSICLKANNLNLSLDLLSDD